MVKARTDTTFGEWLIRKGLLTQRELLEALTEQRRNGGRLGEVLVRLEVFDEQELTKHLAEYLSLDYVQIDGAHDVNINVARELPEKIAQRFSLILIGENENGTAVIMAMADPLDIIALDTVSRKIKRPIEVVISSEKEIRTAIDGVYKGSHVEEERLRQLVDVEIETDDEDVSSDDMMEADIGGSEDDASKPPVINFVDLMLSQAVKSRASDIHMEPQEKNLSIRMRVDGRLVEMISPPRSMQGAVVTRVKILSRMDVAERRLPQDGRFRIRAPGRDIDVRVNSLPTIYGEKVVMRILDKHAVSHDINKIGFGDRMLSQYKDILKQPYGINVITGPTGSGKSTTLYASLNYLKTPEVNITTVENPVEYRLAGINQVQVRSEIGLTFASILRAILRQDPDIVLLGEIRDKETAEIAIQAALTGHLILSTFHTNNAPSCMTRLMFMGLEKFMLASTINLVIAQRLVRKICEFCKGPMTPDDRTLRQLGLSPEQAGDISFYQGMGCLECGGTGYKGRTPVFEFMPINEAMREAVIAGKDELEMREIARNNGSMSLLMNGLERIRTGLTTPEEVLKVTYAEEWVE